MAEMRSAVVAGSKGFVDAVGGHIKMRLGAAPRVARDPAETLRACGDTAGLLVLEYAGGPWLDAVKSLRSACGDAALSIVAAVPAAQASDVQPLQRAGVDEVVSWQGRVDPVLWAVDRVVGRQAAAQSEAPLPAPQASADVEVEKRSELRLVGAPDAPAVVPPPLRSSSPRTAPVPVAPAAEVPWPAAVPTAAAAEALLLSVSVARPLGEVGASSAAEQVFAESSELERAAIQGAEVPVQAAVLRSAAAMRLRLEIALSTVPAAGAAVNHAVAQQLVADVDGALEQLKALADSAPAGVAPSLEPIRLALVDGGVKLANAVSTLVAPAGERAVVPAAPAKVAAGRMLSNEREETTGRRQPVAFWIGLGVALALALAYHGNKLFHRPPVPRASFAGAPANTIGAERGGSKVFSALPGTRIDPGELEQFRVAEQAKGNVVKELAPGTFVVVPAVPASTKGGSP